MFLILGALRGFNAGMMALREKAWRGRPPASLGHEPKDKVLGILGMGGIGRNVRDKAQAFGMKVQYFNRQPLKPDLAGDAKYVDFEELLRTSDVISLNLPLNVQLPLLLLFPFFFFFPLPLLSFSSWFALALHRGLVRPATTTWAFPIPS